LATVTVPELGVVVGGVVIADDGAEGSGAAVSEPEQPDAASAMRKTKAGTFLIIIQYLLTLRWRLF
ncbi:MAG: hypothetical protein ACPHYE_07660, partial [Henriciella sp.]